MAEKQKQLLMNNISGEMENVNNYEVENNEIYNCEEDIEKLFSFNIKDFLKDYINEKEIKSIIELLNEKIKGLNNYINKITKERYEYFYKYVEDIEKIKKKKKKKTKKWNILSKIKTEYINHCIILKENKNNLMRLIEEKQCLTEMEKILKLYLIVEDELEKIKNEIKESKNLEMLHLLKNEDMNVNNENNTNENSPPIYNSNSFFGEINFEIYYNYIIRLHNLYTFIKMNDLEKIHLCEWKMKSINCYEKSIINIFLNYLSSNFITEENYEWNVKQCLNSFVFLNIEKECLHNVCIHKVKDATYFISRIKKRENVRENLFLLVKKCKENMEQLIFLNNMLEEVYSYHGKCNNNVYDITHNNTNNIKNFNNSTKQKQCNKNRTNYVINIHSEFYEPYVKMLIEQHISEYVNEEDILYAINLVEEFFYVIKNNFNLFNIKKKSNDLILHIFKKKYEEITFNSINKLTNIVELLFQKKYGDTDNSNSLNTTNNTNSNNVGGNTVFDYEEEYNFPTAHDIKNYVLVIYKELYIYIFYPYIFRKIIFSCNNSLLLLSNNLNNLKQNIQFLFNINIKNKDVNCLYNYKKFYYNMQLFLLSKKTLKYLLLQLSKLKRKISEVKINAYQYYSVIFGEVGEMVDFNLNESLKAEKNQFISFNFKESFYQCFDFKDYLDCVFFQSEKKKEKDKHGSNCETNGTNETNELHKTEVRKIHEFQLNYASDVKFDGLFLDGRNYRHFGNTEIYEMTPFFIKEEGKSKIGTRDFFFDLLELEKGICELNNASYSFILEPFEIFEKTIILFIKENYNNLSNAQIYNIFDQSCIYFNTIIIQKIPFEEIKQLIINLINRIIVFIICYSSFYLIKDMEIHIFTFLKSLIKLINEDTVFHGEILPCLNWEHKLCTLFKESMEMNNGLKKEEENEKAKPPSCFLPLIFIMQYNGPRIAKYFNESEEKFLQLMIDSLKNPLYMINKKSKSLKRLLFMLNEYAKNVLSKNGT